MKEHSKVSQLQTKAGLRALQPGRTAIAEGAAGCSTYTAPPETLCGLCEIHNGHRRKQLPQRGGQRLLQSICKNSIMRSQAYCVGELQTQFLHVVFNPVHSGWTSQPHFTTGSLPYALGQMEIHFPVALFTLLRSEERIVTIS